MGDVMFVLLSLTTAFFVLVLFTLWNLMTLVYNLGRSHVQENTSVLFLFSFESTRE